MADGKAGRPPREFDKLTFERVCACFCTVQEIEDILHADQRTLDNWCRRTYDEDFSTTLKRFQSNSKMSVRRAQFKSAMGGNVTMLIWLGKMLLGQRDIVEDEKNKETQGVLRNIKKLIEKDDHTDAIDEAEAEPSRKRRAI